MSKYVSRLRYFGCWLLQATVLAFGLAGSPLAMASGAPDTQQGVATERQFQSFHFSQTAQNHWVEQRPTALNHPVPVSDDGRKAIDERAFIIVVLLAGITLLASRHTTGPLK